MYITSYMPTRYSRVQSVVYFTSFLYHVTSHNECDLILTSKCRYAAIWYIVSFSRQLSLAVGCRLLEVISFCVLCGNLEFCSVFVSISSVSFHSRVTGSQVSENS